ncbi:aqualysin-1-like [Patiria miniata]|uniref:Peptidase S8/S53 domain-containing protein n=1 Tax=Patiria miniata TaxID=46514 RepID=A0A913ZCF3_PATMI|nr:aqualysin-1-like [Patiria miniata]XP_038049462.1 aqualysin-1-like [Patiria miniata]
MKSLLFLCLWLAIASCDPLAPLYETDDPVPNSYIVKIKDSVARSFINGQFQNQLERSGFPNAIKRTSTLSNTIVVAIPHDKVDMVRSMEGVEYVEQDGYVYPDDVGSWGIDRIDQNDLPLDDSYEPGSDGEGVDVYVIDTGILYDHEEFEGRAFFGQDFIEDGRAGLDCHSHGTHCAGTIAGKTYGVAKKANVWSVRVFACSGGTPKSIVIAAMEWVAENGKSPAIVSMSLGGSFSVTQNNVVSRLFNVGFTVVVAAGNANIPACQRSPGSAPKSITVGSTTDTDARSYFSNYGTCVDIFAPGSSILSAGIESNRDVSTKSGTSMACPHVAGVAALELGKNKNLTPADITEILLSKAVKDRVANAGPESPNLLLRI